MIRIAFLIGALLFAGCKDTNKQSVEAIGPPNLDRQILKGKLDVLEKELQNDQSSKIDRSKATSLVEKSIQYVNAFPKDTLSAGYLFRAGDVSIGLGEYQKAVDYWERLQTDYKTFDKVSMALFMQGFTCDNHLNDKEKAASYYKDFLKKYPAHQYAEQVKTLLAQLDKTPEDLIKEFKKKNQ